MIEFLLGVLCGCIIGVFLCALSNAAKRSDIAFKPPEENFEDESQDNRPH